MKTKYGYILQTLMSDILSDTAKLPQLIFVFAEYEKHRAEAKPSGHGS